MTSEAWSRMVGSPPDAAETWRIYRRTGVARDKKGVARNRWELVRIGDAGVREQEWPVAAFGASALSALDPGVYRIEWRAGRRCVGRGPVWELAGELTEQVPAAAETPELSVVATIAQQVEAQVEARSDAIAHQAQRERDFFAAASEAERGRARDALAAERARIDEDRRAMREHYAALQDLATPDLDDLRSEIDDLRARPAGDGSVLDRLVDAAGPGVGALMSALADMLRARTAPAPEPVSVSRPTPAGTDP